MQKLLHVVFSQCRCQSHDSDAMHGDAFLLARECPACFKLHLALMMLFDARGMGGKRSQDIVHT